MQKLYNRREEPPLADDRKIQVTKNGPYIVHGNVPLCEDALAKNEDGVQDYFTSRSFATDEKGYALCRCGQSGHKPFCDGTHEKIEWNGSETAGHEPYTDRVQVFPGRDIDLDDDNRCAYARLCHRKQGDVWTLTEKEQGGELEEQAALASWHCPTGRLQHEDNKTGHVYEQEYAPSILILEDTEEGVSGPLFVRGGIPLYDEDGVQYEKRNRYALCRCGGSQNKPFCDAEHVPGQFHDGSPALQGQFGGHDDSFKGHVDLDLS